jgi:hypothetical protein
MFLHHHETIHEMSRWLRPLFPNPLISKLTDLGEDKQKRNSIRDSNKNWLRLLETGDTNPFEDALGQ